MRYAIAYLAVAVVLYEWARRRAGTCQLPDCDLEHEAVSEGRAVVLATFWAVFAPWVLGHYLRGLTRDVRAGRRTLA